MKTILLFIHCFCLYISAFAQQSTQPDNNLLLEYYQTQRFADAANYLKKTYPEPVTDSKALASLAYTSQMAGRLPDAEGYYQRIYEQDSTRTPILYSLGSINLRRGNNAKAMIYYKKILLRDSTNYSVYKQLAKISFDNTDIPAYATYLDKANQLNPTDADIASELSDLYVNLKLNPKAEQVLSRAVAADEENIVLQESLLKLVYAQSKWNEVITVGEKLLQLGNRSPVILSKIGQAYFNVRDYQCGIQTLTAIDNISQNESTYYFTAACYKQLKNQLKAIEYFKKSVDAGISANIDAYYNEIADSYSTIKNPAKALGAYQKALQFNERPMTYYAIANLYDTELKNKKNAIRYYKKYLAAKPPAKQQSYIACSKSRIAILND
ncbi:MAG TPA: hypothetical protein VK668_22940 [Mucilaginibacter sp.]|nr:hypothetical protein [Mucilaginibacter sp.]